MDLNDFVINTMDKLSLDDGDLEDEENRDKDKMNVEKEPFKFSFSIRPQDKIHTNFFKTIQKEETPIQYIKEIDDGNVIFQDENYMNESKEENEFVIPLYTQTPPNYYDGDLENAPCGLIIMNKNSEGNNKKKTTYAKPLFHYIKDEKERLKLDIISRPSEDDIDFSRIPLGEFGKAMLKGMGWKEGDGIGLNPSRDVENVIYKVRPPRLGLGAKVNS